MIKYILLSSFTLFILCGCHNPDDPHYPSQPKVDTTVNGAVKATDIDYGKTKEKYNIGNPAVDNQRNRYDTSESGIPDSNTNPLNDKEALKKSNSLMSGTGKSGHTTVNNSDSANKNRK